MKYLKSFLFFSALLFSSTIIGQENVTEFSLKKGEVLDILIFKTNQDIETHFGEYKKTAFPVAMKHSYQPLPGYGISQTLSGNILPNSLVFGKWNSKEQREEFNSVIDEEVPNFHEMRKNIWTFFYLTYYTMEKDISFSVNNDKYLVATAYWGESETEVSNLVDSYEKGMNKKGGHTVLRLGEGASPFGYLYAPDQFIISAWLNEQSYLEFKKSSEPIDKTVLCNYQQFELQ